MSIRKKQIQRQRKTIDRMTHAGASLWCQVKRHGPVYVTWFRNAARALSVEIERRIMEGRS